MFNQDAIKRASRIGHFQSSNLASVLQNPFEFFFAKQIAAGFITAAQRDRVVFFITAAGIFSVIVGLAISYFALLIIPLCVIAAFLIVEIQTKKQLCEFEKDFCALLTVIYASIKGGLDPLSALTQAREFFKNDSVMGLELLRVKKNVEQGFSEDYSINSFAKNMGLAEVSLFRTAFILARKEGGSLTECLSRLVRVVRIRQSAKRKARAAVALQRASSFAIAVLCVLLIILQLSSFDTKSITSLSYNMYAGAALLISTGLFWVTRMGTWHE